MLVSLAHDHVQPHQHVQDHHPEALGRLEVQMVDLGNQGFVVVISYKLKTLN